MKLLNGLLGIKLTLF